MTSNDDAKLWLDTTTRVLLIVGTWASFILILFGGIGVIYQYGARPLSPHAINSANFGLLPHNNIFESLPHTIIEIGLLLLVVIQVCRVVLLFLYYLKLKDKPFILISGFILIGLLYSLLWHYT